MRHDVPADGFGGILREAHAIWVGHYLVGDEDRYTKFFRQSSELAQKLRHLHLALGQLPTAGVVCSKQGRGGVHHEQRVTVLGHNGSCHLEQLHLVFRVVRSSVCHILQGYRRIETKSLGNGLETCGTKGSLRVNINGFAFGTSFRYCHLAGDTECVTQLRLPGSEFAEYFSDRASLDSALQQFVDLDGASREGH